MGSLAVPRESYSSLGSVFIIGTGGKKSGKKKGGDIKKRAGHPRGAMSARVRLSKAVGRHNCGRDTLRNPNKQPPVDMGSLSTWLSSLTEKPSRLPTATPLYHTMKKSTRIVGKEKWMSHQCGKPQLALIMNKTYFLWTLLQLWYPIKDYFKALGFCCCCRCSRSPGPSGFLHTAPVIVSLRTER